MKTKPVTDEFLPQAQRDRSRIVRRRGRFALATGALLLISCGGGGDSTPLPASVPLVWNQAQATWDNVNWQ